MSQSKIYAFDLQRKGGNWLGATRSYLQSHVRGGDTNIWGSNQTVTLTMAQVEELGAESAAAAINEWKSKQNNG